VPHNNINKSQVAQQYHQKPSRASGRINGWNNKIIFRAACAAALLFFWFAPPRFCFGNSIVMPDLIRHPVHLAPRLTRGHSEA